MNQQEFIKNAAKKLCNKLWQSAEWMTFGYNLIPNGFEIKDDGKVTQKYVFDFDKNIFTVFDKEHGKWVEWESFYIHDDIFEFDVQVGKKYFELNKPQPGDKKFYVNTIVDGYIDPETQAWMDQRSQEEDFDPDDDEFDFCDYQKHEICILYAPDIKTIKEWQKSWDNCENCSRGFILTDSEGNDAWAGNIVEASVLEKSPNKKRG